MLAHKQEEQEQLQQSAVTKAASATPRPQASPASSGLSDRALNESRILNESNSDTDRVTQFLEANECLEFRSIFMQHEIDADTIPYLTETDLIAMGIHSVGPRRKLLTLCQTAGGSPSIASKLRQRQFK